MTKNNIGHRIQEDTVKKFSAILIAMAVGLTATASADAKGDQVAALYFGHTKPADTSANAVMTLIDKAGNKKIRELDMFTKDSAVGQFSFTEIKKPADVKEPWDYYDLLQTIPAEEAAQPLSQSRCPLVTQSH